MKRIYMRLKRPDEAYVHAHALMDEMYLKKKYFEVYRILLSLIPEIEKKSTLNKSSKEKKKIFLREVFSKKEINGFEIQSKTSPPPPLAREHQEVSIEGDLF